MDTNINKRKKDCKTFFNFESDKTEGIVRNKTHYTRMV